MDASVEDAAPGLDALSPDAFEPDATPLDTGLPIPSAVTLNAAGSRVSSTHFTMFFTLGQPTPSGAGTMRSTNYKSSVGILGGNQ
jgi:hypothetical protein